MNRVALTFILLALPVAQAGAQTKPIQSFDELMAALRSGKEVRAVIHYAKCKLVADSVEVKAPDAIGGMSLSTFEYFARMSVRNARAFVTSSETVLISHPRYGYVYNYVKIRIYEDSRVEITARYLAPNTLKVVMDETFYGAISAGDDQNGVFLFED